MDTSFIAVCLILVGIVSIPFFLFNAAGQSERKKIKAKIKQVIVKNGLNISESENWGLRYLGIDTVQRKVLFLKSMQSEDIIQLLDLNTIKACQIAEKRKAIRTKDRKELMLEKLDLEILLKNGDNLFLSFYDMNDDQMEDLELPRIEKWKAILIGHTSRVTDEKKAA